MSEKCPDCGQPMLPKGETKRPNKYDHASGCPRDTPKWQQHAEWDAFTPKGEQFSYVRVNGQPVAICTGAPKKEQNAANAQLFAAAGDLYKVAARVVEWMDANGHGPEDESFGARAAMAKARGVK